MTWPLSRSSSGADFLFDARWILPAGYGVLLIWVLFLHARIASLLGDAGLVASDPPAHFTSGVLVYDYLRTALGTNPMSFAESYYVRYPKVAIGHWPPVYYAVQAAWYGLFGACPWTARALSAATAAVLAGVLWRRLRPAYGGGLGLGAALALLAMPCVQRTAWDVMSDLLTGLFVLLSIFAFADLLDGRGRRAGIRFLAWSLLGVLTKGTALALAPFVLLAPALAGRVCRYQSFWYWGGGLVLVAMGSLFYLAMHFAGMGYPVALGSLLRRLAAARLDSEALHAWFSLAPPLVFGLAFLGFLDAVWVRWRTRDASPDTTDALVAAALMLAQILFMAILNLTHEPRAFLPSLAPAILLLARTTGRASSLVPTRYAGLVALLVLGITVGSGGAVDLNRVDGYESAAAAIPYPDGGTLIMIGSDPAGEGAFIVERLIHDPKRAGVVMRAGSFLAESNWMGTRSRPLFDSPAQVAEALKALPVRYIVMDGSAEATPELKLLAETLASDAAFQPVGSFPITGRAQPRRGDLRIYENLAAGNRHPAVIRVHLGLDRGGRVLEYRWP